MHVWVEHSGCSFSSSPCVEGSEQLVPPVCWHLSDRVQQDREWDLVRRLFAYDPGVHGGGYLGLPAVWALAMARSAFMEQSQVFERASACEVSSRSRAASPDTLREGAGRCIWEGLWNRPSGVAMRAPDPVGVVMFTAKPCC